MKKRVLCFGDSNTWGYNGEDGSRFEEDVRWTGILQQLLGDEYTVIEEGHNGRTTVWDDPIENRLAGLTYLWPCMESQSPFDLIIIMLGTNDVLGDPDAERIAQSMRAFLLALRQKLPDCPVLLTAPPIVRGYGETAEEASMELPALYEALAEELGLAFTDSSTWQIAMGADGVHFSPRGHAIYAAKMAQRILALGI